MEKYECGISFRHPPRSIRANEPLHVKSNFYVVNLNSFDPNHMDYRMDYYLMHFWETSSNDCEKYKEIFTMANETVVINENYLIPKSLFALFWIPDTILAQSKSVMNTFGEIPNEFVEISFRETKCEMTYFSSYAFIDNIREGYHDTIIEWQAYRRSFISLDLKVKRQFGHHLMNDYAPMACIVMSSFAAFWLQEASERITLSITSLLALITQANEARAEMPDISYITALDHWVNFCLFLSFLSLCFVVTIEYWKYAYLSNFAECIYSQAFALISEPI
ncbi:glycine receptor subunit alpha-2-like protein [Leptotrombidium deliense]|uniref:Glycine receptor subunit alpha-2-like protein n=1 Tax=Leptotrombidium deliense TaxID=299467 RepID=A0A443SX02_9ACAR|nr:glycine receptor subunit alpha-2-like protein [Leptotrombidium deliense]